MKRNFRSEREKISGILKLTPSVFALAGAIVSYSVFDKPVLPEEPESASIYNMAERSSLQIQGMLDSPYFSSSGEVVVPGREELQIAGRKISDFVDTSEFREDARSYREAVNQYQEDLGEWCLNNPIKGFVVGAGLGFVLSVPGYRRLSRLKKEEELDKQKTD